MVDRLFWRAGFGPTDAGPRDLDRQARQRGGRLAAVGPGGRRRLARARATASRWTRPATTPTSSSSWVDRMVRSTNPFVERMAFFWHRHWANSRESVSPPQLLLQQNDLFRRYADFGANAGASFRDLALRADGRPGDAALPHRRVQREGRAERELRPRADGALRPRRRRTRPASRTTARTTCASSRRRCRGGRSTTPTPTTRRATSRRTAGTTARRSSSASSATTSRTRRSTSCSPTRPTRRSSSQKLWGEFVVAAAGRGDARSRSSRRTRAAG